MNPKKITHTSFGKTSKVIFKFLLNYNINSFIFLNHENLILTNVRWKWTLLAKQLRNKKIITMIFSPNMLLGVLKKSWTLNILGNSQALSLSSNFELKIEFLWLKATALTTGWGPCGFVRGWAKGGEGVPHIFFRLFTWFFFKNMINTCFVASAVSVGTDTY